MIRNILPAIALLALMAATAPSNSCQSNLDLETFFRQNIGLGQDQIAAIQSGQPVAKTLPPPTPAEVFLFGAVYVRAAPETYTSSAIWNAVASFPTISRLACLPSLPNFPI